MLHNINSIGSVPSVGHETAIAHGIERTLDLEFGIQG